MNTMKMNKNDNGKSETRSLVFVSHFIRSLRNLHYRNPEYLKTTIMTAFDWRERGERMARDYPQRRLSEAVKLYQFIATL